jgi:hypothetical protein
MTKKLVGTIAMALGLFGAQAQAATGHDSVYLRDSAQGAMELSNVPQGQGYKHLLDATVPTTPQAPAAAQPAVRSTSSAAPAPAANTGSADPAAADGKDAGKEKDKDKLADGSDPLYTGAGGYASGSSFGGGSGGGAGSSQSALTVPRATPGTDINAAMAAMSTPIDPALATQLQQYRALMLQQANPSTGLPGNPAKSRRYLMMDRATYQATVGK